MIWDRKAGRYTGTLSKITLLTLMSFSSAQALAEQTTSTAADAKPTSTDTLTVTGSEPAAPPPKTMLNAGASKKDLERRKASHLSDVVDQISGTSMNSLYARPDVSIGIQGVAGYGRVSQQLEGISQNFTAFTRDIGQTGSIYVEPQFLQSIDVTRGVNTSTGTLGSLGGSVNFRYLDIDDVLRPGKSLGGMVRGSTGFSQYANGQKPSGAAFLAGRDESWDVLLGVSRSKNDAYSVGSNFNQGEMLNGFHATNLQFYDDQNTYYNSAENCRYGGVTGVSGGFQDGLNNCMLTPQRLQWLKQAAKSGALKGTERTADSQMLRLRHYFNDEFNQRLDLFASASHSRFESDQKPQIKASNNGTDAEWFGSPWSVKNELDSRVISLKYQGEFSDLINPSIQIYHEQQRRKQGWLGIAGSYAYNQPLHYDVDNQSNGIKLANSSHFSLPVVGNWRLDAGAELRREKKTVDSLSEEDALQKQYAQWGLTYVVPEWDTDSRTITQSLALNLSTDDDGPLKISAGVGFQHVAMDVYSPRYLSGNIGKGGTIPGFQPLIDQYISAGESYADATEKALEELTAATDAVKIDPSNGNGYTRWVTDNQKHHYNLKSGNLAVQYTLPGTGLTPYASLGYGERAPTSGEMYISGAWMRQAFIANPDLKPEKNLSLQLGLNYHRPALFTESDDFSAGVGFYRNRIKDYIGYGPLWMSNDIIGENGGSAGQSVGSVNNLSAVIRQGFEFNLAYQQPLFYIRSNLTVPLRHDNKMCSANSPSGNYYTQSIADDGTTTITRGSGNGGQSCYSGWNWMETSQIEPIRGSLTAAITPYHGQLELGATLIYRGKQRAAYWYVKDAQPGSAAEENSQQSLPDHDGWITANLWPKTFKVDLFANYKVTDDLKLGVYLANLTNQMDGTTTSMGYNFYPGRTFTANLEYRF
ncbi:TonB-dependent receptor domain-containing protein [Candidatus Pantoea formicae]|uniref:TonB-dependent receptor domain-containing protein n=1 Tax=Candidatus Pantoea formicae TaxID=2608355 RepID=UPI003EDA61AA